MEPRPNFSFIVNDNESAARQAFDRGDYVQALLLIHSLMESLLRLFLNETGDEVKFSNLIKKYDEYLDEQNYPTKTLVNELTEFNRRRNRIIHELWRRGYSYTNRRSRDAANAALVLYGLAIEFLETWDAELPQIGFKHD